MANAFKTIFSQLTLLFILLDKCNSQFIDLKDFKYKLYELSISKVRRTFYIIFYFLFISFIFLFKGDDFNDELNGSFYYAIQGKNINCSLVKVTKEN